jgi:hypothetical protein
MSFLLPLAIALGISFVPVWLVRAAKSARAQDYFIAGKPVPPDVMRNSFVAYFLRIATFAALFAWGASGDFLPAAIVAVCLGLGIYLVSLLREPLLGFLDMALSAGTSATVHAFLAAQHGNEARLRLLAAWLTVVALTGLITAEAFAGAILVRPFAESAAGVYLVAGGMLLLALLYTTVSGNSGVMHSVQLQLGLVYFGLFGSVALILYFIVSDASPTAPQAKFAVGFVAAAGALIMLYRRSKYVDTAQIEASLQAESARRSSVASRLLSRLEKILNPFISAIVVFVIVLTGMEIFSVGPSAMARDSIAAFAMGTSTSGMTLGSLSLLALLYPLVDARTWQTMAAVVKATQCDPVRRPATVERVLHSAAVEVPLVWLLITMFGTLAALVTDAPAGREALLTFMDWLVAEQGGPADVVLSFFLVGLFVMALSAMSSMLSAMLWVMRYDVLPALSRDPPSRPARAVVAGAGMCVLAILLVYAAAELLGVKFTSSSFLVLLVGCCCAQLALAPLLMRDLLTAGRSTTPKGLSAPWSLGAILAAAGTGIIALVLYGGTGSEAWLWAALPLTIGTGIAVLLIARFVRPS